MVLRQSWWNLFSRSWLLFGWRWYCDFFWNVYVFPLLLFQSLVMMLMRLLSIHICLGTHIILFLLFRHILILLHRLMFLYNSIVLLVFDNSFDWCVLYLDLFSGLNLLFLWLCLYWLFFSLYFDILHFFCVSFCNHLCLFFLSWNLLLDLDWLALGCFRP